MRYCVLAIGFLLSACASMDMQGHDPKEYYAKHPKVNKLEERSVAHVVQFEKGTQALEPAAKNALHDALRGISPEASERVEFKLSPSQVNNTARRDSLHRMVRSFGYAQTAVEYSADSQLGSNEARVIMHYVAVVTPDCPDWRMSPVTTYSNTHQGNFGCASVVNLGLMVADPHDLVRGEGTSYMDTQRNSQVITDYRAGKDFGKSDDAASEPTNLLDSSAGQ
jgi:pilus biogenesis lipoprotein CpaD